MNKLILIAGPCVVESEEITMQVAEHLVKICKKLPVELIFKASYRKANRTSLDSFKGIGDVKALQILARVNDRFGIPVTTDIHEVEEAKRAAIFVQMIQIPAFLCRQTDLLRAAGLTGLPVNIKKGQFMSAEAMEHAVEKVRSFGTTRVMITERGNSFGYNDVVIDMRNIQLLQALCDKVLVDITHTNGGNWIQSFALGKAAIAAGADGIFLETHPTPSKALSDGKNMLPLSEVENLLIQLVQIKGAIQ
jgi:2-dehydro-3-deoxyphosphooctonate aldolase (KDO 8-P synthase)